MDWIKNLVLTDAIVQETPYILGFLKCCWKTFEFSPLVLVQQS